MYVLFCRSIFYRIVKKKATDGFQSVPYVAALFSAMLWIFYAYIKTGEMLIITINLFGCAIETIYLGIYMIYCPRKARVRILLSSLFIIKKLIV
jgi:solute carrier family 50 protein (sugar transporter)